MMWLSMYRPRFVMFYPVLWTAIRNKRINKQTLCMSPVTKLVSFSSTDSIISDTERVTQSIHFVSVCLDNSETWGHFLRWEAKDDQAFGTVSLIIQILILTSGVKLLWPGQVHPKQHQQSLCWAPFILGLLWNTGNRRTVTVEPYLLLWVSAVVGDNLTTVSVLLFATIINYDYDDVSYET